MESTFELRDLKCITQKMSSLTNQYINKLGADTTIILLIGLTGAGKSTFFNFLCGAEFVFGDKDLELKHPSDEYSRMQGGLVSVTKEPKFYMNTNNKHLLIDFPGFQDTTGGCDQLLFDLLFNKIVSIREVKILYVIKNPQSTLPTRGSDLHSFINQLDNPNFNLLLNCYIEELDDQALISDIKNELEKANLHNFIDQIIVQRKGTKRNLAQRFNNNHRQTVWDQIIKMKKVQIKTKIIPKSELLSKFLIAEATKQIQEKGKIMQNFFSQKVNETTLQNEQMLANLKLFKVLMRNEKGFTAFQWFEEFIKICEKLTNNQNTSQKTISQDFIGVFQYFEQFKEFINGYQQLQTINEFAKETFKQIEILIDTKIELIEKWKQAELEKKKAEQEKRQAEEEKQKAEQEKQKAEQEKQKAEQEKQKAEEEAKNQRYKQQREIERLNRQYELQEQKYRRQAEQAEQAEIQKKKLEAEQTKRDNEEKIRQKQIEERQIEKLKIEKSKIEELSQKQQNEIEKNLQEQKMKQEMQVRMDYKIKLILSIDDKIKKLKEAKQKYIDGQKGLVNFLISGDWEEDYKKTISDFDKQIQDETTNKNYAQQL